MSALNVPNPRPALTAFGFPEARLLPVRATAFSGASVWRVEAGDATFALKAYPPAWGDAAKLSAIHDQLTAAIGRGVDVLPRPVPAAGGRTAVEIRGRVWDLVTWRPGRPLLADAATPQRLAAALAALARLHIAWARERNNLAICPAVRRRLTALNEWATQHADVASAHPFADRIGTVARLMPELAARARAHLEPWQQRPVAVQDVLSDVWHAHVLFEGDAVTGLVDHGSVKADHIAADLARLLGSLNVPSETRAAGLAAYETIRPLSADELALAAALEASGPAVQLIQWHRWLAVERREFTDLAAVAARLDFLLRRAV